MSETIYLTRHGSRLNWVSTVWKSETGLPRDPPLAALGLTEAHELAAHFLALPIEKRPTAILSSPYYRCLQTAQPTAEALGIPIYVEHGLSEWYSPVVPGTGLHPRPGPASSLTQHFPQIDSSWDPILYPSRRGEGVAELHERAASFLRAFLPELERRTGAGGGHARVLLVSHAATVIVLARALLGDPELPLRVGCCSLTEVERKPGGDGWEARRLVDGRHLSGGLNREWGLEDIEVSEGVVVEDPGEPILEGEVDEPVGLQVQIRSSL